MNAKMSNNCTYITFQQLLILIAKTLLQMYPCILVITQKQQTNMQPNKVYIWRLSFKTRLQDWAFCGVEQASKLLG